MTWAILGAQAEGLVVDLASHGLPSGVLERLRVPRVAIGDQLEAGVRWGTDE